MLFRPCVGVLAVFSALLLTFSACGDDSSSSANALPDEVADKAELKTYECNMSIIGEKVFVNDLDKYYECDGDEWFESYDQTKPHNKGNSSSSSRSSSSGKNLSSSNNSSSSSGGIFGDICRDKGGCEALEESYVNRWHFYLEGASGGFDEYSYSMIGKDLRVSIAKANGERDYKTYSMYDMETEDGKKMAFNFVKSTCENGNGNDRIVNVCEVTLIEQDSIIDERDGQVYKTVKIGDQWWMAENLRYMDNRYKSGIKSRRSEIFYSWAAAVDSIKLYTEKKDSITCGLECVVDASGVIQGLCPDGWHLPDTTEWTELFLSIGAYSSSGEYDWARVSSLQSKTGWGNYRNGDDVYGFNVIPVGYLFNDKQYDEGTSAYFLSSTPSGYEFGAIQRYGNMVHYVRLSTAYESYRESIRCVKNRETTGKSGWILPKCNMDNQMLVSPKETLRYICDNGVWREATFLERETYGFDESCTKSDSGRVVGGHLSDSTRYYCTTKGWADYVQWNWDVPKESRFNPNVKYGTLVDERDGKVYKTVDIAGQTWMAENLNYADSVNTPSLLKNSWCFKNVDANCNVGGRLYSWNAAIDYKAFANDENNPQNCTGDSTCLLAKVRGICPEGWHLPNYKDWSYIEELGSSAKSSSGWNRWRSEDTKQFVDGNGSNESGFSVVPTGERYWYLNKSTYSSNYEVMWRSGSESYFWSSSRNGGEVYYYIISSRGNGSVATTSESKRIEDGYSVRCVKD